MHGLVIIIIGCVMLDDYFVRLLGLPGVVRFLPECLSAIVTLYVFFVGTRGRFRLVAAKYWIAFGAMSAVILCGVFSNETGAGPMLSGMRFYARAVPLFFLPAVLPLTEVQLKKQLKWILGLALLQVPVSVYQRWVIQSQGRFSGDDVRGTLMDSGIVSLFLICVVVVLTGLVLRRRIGKIRYTVLFVLLLIPTAINETKVTVIFLPLGLMATLFLGAEPGKRLRYAGLALAGLVVVGALFVPVYNMTQVYNPYKNEKDITAFFTNEKQLGRYLSSNVSGLGTKKDVRRGDAIVVPFDYIAKDPVHLMFGLGLGAVSPSNLGKNFEGTYFALFDKFLIISFTVFLLEFGVLGVAMIFVIFWLIFVDTLKVARRDETFVGAFAVGWTGVVILFVVDVFYTVFHEFTSVTYLFWYLSGIICAQCVSLGYRDEPLFHGGTPSQLDAAA